MSQKLRQLERIVEREMKLLEALPSVAASPAALERTRARMREELARRATSLRLATLRRWTLGLAAAAALVAAIVSPTSTTIDNEPDLDAWIAAMDTSSAKLVAVFNQDALPDEWRGEDDAAAELEAWSESFDTSLNHFGAL